MHILESMYRAPFGRVISFVARLLPRVCEPFVAYRYHDCSPMSFRKYMLITSPVRIMKRKLSALAVMPRGTIIRSWMRHKGS